jgi:hypothetical protein
MQRREFIGLLGGAAAWPLFGGTAETRTLRLSVQSIGKLEWRRAMVTEGPAWP